MILACRGCGRTKPGPTGDPTDIAPSSHCGECPPWRCDTCGQTCSFAAPCPCWTPVDLLVFADLKAAFATIDLSITTSADPTERTMTDTTPALDLDAIRERHARAERFGGVALRAEVCDDVPGMLDELATLRRELAEARQLYDELVELVCAHIPEEYDRDEAVQAIIARWLAGTVRERDEAVAETARVRTVYRDALARWRDELTQLRKAVTTIAARRERERPDDIIVDALRAALDGAATTGPETAPAPICGYRDHDLATNRPLVCVLPAGHPPVAHGFDFVSAEGGAS